MKRTATVITYPDGSVRQLQPLKPLSRVPRRIKERMGYRWVDHDPILLGVVAILREEGLDKPGPATTQRRRDVCAEAGISLSTLDAWLGGWVLKPQNITLWSVSKVLARRGYQDRLLRIIAASWSDA